MEPLYSLDDLTDLAAQVRGIRQAVADSRELDALQQALAEADPASPKQLTQIRRRLR